MRFLLYVIVLLMAAGCGYSAQDMPMRGLDEAERLLLSDPGIAMEKLNGFDVAECRDSAILARWALLYSEAMVANKLTAPSDTIVDIAIAYYSGHGQGEELRHASRLKALMRSYGENNRLATALYLQKEKEFRVYELRMRQRMLLLGGIVSLLLALSVIVWQRQRLRLREAQNEALIAEALCLRDGLVKNQSDCEVLNEWLRSELAGRFSMIDELCSTYYESQGTKTERKAIAEKVKAQIESLKDDGGLLGEMERSVNRCRSGILDEMQAEFPQMKDDERRLMVYLLSGLSNRSIALLIGESIEVVYKRKSRLKAKIAASGAPHKERFMEAFA